MDRIFNNRYDKKRLAPGKVTGTNSNRLFHDCTTLGGNSGGEVVSLKTGEAVALHFAGTMFKRNHAVPADIVAQRLDDVLRGRRSPSVGTSKDSEAIQLQSNVGMKSPQAKRNVFKTTIPIHITIELGEQTNSNVSGVGLRTPPSIPAASFAVEDDLQEITEARPEDYHDRNGYDPEFLSQGFIVPLPELTADQEDIVTHEVDGTVLEVLDYRHFSVLMGRQRRMCRYSACNIDGSKFKKRSRKSWRFDPRIPEEMQIMKECYGNQPKFSRGHMTRRNDPSWGEHALQGNVDSMHVTNATPQIQPFNAGIWLDLEDYALENAKDDDMRISVFTGPIFNDSDPVRFGVQIPLRFWKVIAFIHDQTGKLTATGYTMSQESFIGEEEFVFGQHESSQRPIVEIEHVTNLSFGPLSDVDPMREMTETMPTLLTDPNQIRWR